MTDSRGRPPAHPFLVALVPVWSLWSSNADQVDPLIPIMASLVSLMLACALLWLAGRICSSWNRAALLASLALVLFYSAGFLSDAMSGAGAAAVSVGVLVAAAIALARTRFDVSVLANIVTAGSAALLAYALLQLAVSGWSASSAKAATEAALAGPGIAAGEPRPATGNPELPDIYFIVLDGYAGEEVLRRDFGTDNGPFLDGLRERGFYVANRSRANYAMTHLSLSSVLNASYLDALVREVGEESVSFDAPYALLRQHWVGRFLRAQGYRYVQWMTNWGGTENSDIADEALSYVPRWLRSEFTGVLLRATALRELAPSVAGFHQHAFESLRNVPEMPGPTFLFAHILLPHAPYVFDRDGQVRADIPLHLRASPVEKDKSAAGRADAAYADQLAYLNGEITALVDHLLKHAKRPPVIVIQGDHGWAPASVEPGSSEFVRARFPILNAFHVPESTRDRLYPSISSVNTFRLLFSELFALELPLLPDRHYWSWYDAPYRLLEVTDRVHNDGP